MKIRIKIPYVFVLIVAQLAMTFAGHQMTLDGQIIPEAVVNTGGLSGIIDLIVNFGPIILAVLILAAVILEKQRRIVAEVAAVICYLLGAAYLLRAFGNVVYLVELYKQVGEDVDILIQSVIMTPVVLHVFSGWIYFLVAARIQDEEITGGHGALGTLGCIGLFLTGVMGAAFNYSFFNVLPMILQLCYIKRLPGPFAGGGNVTTIKNILTVAVVLALYFVGPTLGIGI